MAGLAVALHMPLLAEARLEKVPLIPPIAAVRSVVGLVVAPMLPPTATLPAGATPPGFGSLQ